MFSLISYSMVGCFAFSFFLSPHKFTPDQLHRSTYVCCTAAPLTTLCIWVELYCTFRLCLNFSLFYAIIWISSCISPNSPTSSIMGFYADRSKAIRGNLHAYFSWQDNPDIYFKHTRKNHYTTLQRFGNFLFCLVFFLLSLRFSQSYHLPIFTFSTVNFRFQREIKFHTFTISAESSIDSFSRRLERTVDFFSFHTHTSHSGERRKSTSKSPPEQLTTWDEDCWANTNSSNGWLERVELAVRCSEESCVTMETETEK